MLHSLTSETKAAAALSKPQQVLLSERELHLLAHSTAGPYSRVGTSKAAFSSTPGIQRRQTLAGLQATYGNQAVLRTLHTSPQVARMTPLRPSRGVMLQRKCACGGSSESKGECAECKAKREAVVQRRIANQGSSPAAANGVPSVVHDVLRSPGQPLDAGIRAFMEPRFGHDLSKVRIHGDEQAAAAADSVNANAYTVGQDIVFASGQYRPHTSTGKQLLAHELAHVIQQSRGGHSTPPPLPTHPLERAAHQAAAIVTSGGTIQVEGASAPGIARQPRSLNQSLNPKQMSYAELQQEIALIQEYLSLTPISSSDRDLLNAALINMEAEMEARQGPPGRTGSYMVPRLGARKQAISSSGGSVLDMAVAMLETDTMQASFYPYGDGKSGDAANFGIFKQNWLMIRTAVPQYLSLTASDYNRGAALNSNLSLDIQVLHASQQLYGIDAWFAGHRNGPTGLTNPNTSDINNYKDAVYWIKNQIDSDPKYLTDDTRFWVAVPAI